MCICLDSLVMEEKAQSEAEGRMARAKKCLLLSIVVTESKKKISNSKNIIK